MPTQLICAMLGYCKHYNCGILGIGLIWMFFGLLRPGEFFSLRYCDVSFTVIGSAYAALTHTKTNRAKNNAAEMACIKDGPATALLRQWMGERNDQTLVFTGSPTIYRGLFDQCLTFLVNEAHEFKLYSLRRGGASRLIEFLPMEVLLIRGRWGSTKTARTYIESARAEVIWFKFEPELMTKLNKYAQYLLND